MDGFDTLGKTGLNFMADTPDGRIESQHLGNVALH
jgi:hypothetical protein